MTRVEAEQYVRSCSEDEGPETYAEAAEIFAAIFGRRPVDGDGGQGEMWSHCCAAVAEQPWAVIDTREGGCYGRVVSRHVTERDANAAGSAHSDRELGGDLGHRPAATRDAIPRLMWDVAQVDGAIGARVRYR